MRFSAQLLPSRIGIVAILSLIVWTGCTWTNKDNRVLLNKMDKTIQPQSTTAQVALAPVMIPAGTAALAIDVAVIHPVVEIPDAWDDVYKLYWQPREITPFRRAMFFVPIVALTPVTFVGDWTLRIIFPID